MGKVLAWGQILVRVKGQILARRRAGELALMLDELWPLLVQPGVAVRKSMLPQGRWGDLIAGAVQSIIRTIVLCLKSLLPLRKSVVPPEKVLLALGKSVVSLEKSVLPQRNGQFQKRNGRGLTSRTVEFTAEHATMFDIFQKGPGDANFVQIVNDDITREYSASGLAAGTYEFKVSGQNSLGNGPLSEVTTIVVAPTGLAQPTGLQLQQGPMNSINANWNAVVGANHYVVEHQRVGTDPSFTQVDTTTGTSLSFGGYSGGTTVRVRVKAIGTPGPGCTPESPYSELAEITFP